MQLEVLEEGAVHAEDHVQVVGAHLGHLPLGELEPERIRKVELVQEPGGARP